jgi:vacuolar-type H+-ATPase subunit I/STV1
LWREVQLLIVSLSLGFIMMAMGLTFGLKYSIAL